MENGRNRYDSRVQPAWGGPRFVNPEPVKQHRAWDIARWVITGRRTWWPRLRPNPAGDTPPARVDGGALRYLLVNHATVLIQTDGVNILTDPIWSKHPSMVSWAGPRRSVSPGVSFDQLPTIDVVLLTHNHYDHMDIPTLKCLADRDNPLMVAGLGNSRTLQRHGLTNLRELDWWETVRAGETDICFTPARHFSRRGLFDYNRSLWGSFVIKSGYGPVFFAGDTGYGDFFKIVRRRFGPMALAFIPIGAYRPRWMMGTVHLDPKEAWQTHLDLKAACSVGIHFGTFQLTDEGIDEPVAEIQRRVAEHNGPAGRFVVPQFGESVVAQ